tara:strand:+ start:284 stop:967 length:684 start_codon:yes stop_codon:yes gene_type:complete
MKRKILIACSKAWFFKNNNYIQFKNKKNIILIRERKKLNLRNLNKIKPEIIFFPHWSYKVNESILKKFNCICFHTAPLPYGRGGSPIQNLIIKKYKKAPVCAIKMTKKIDAGPIYLKENISLSGSLDSIFNRISIKIIRMMDILIKKKIKPKKQIGKIFIFNRLKKSNSEIKKNQTISEIYDKIRMLDYEGYPYAFIKKDNFKIYLSNPIMKKKVISCEAKIYKSRK